MTSRKIQNLSNLNAEDCQKFPQPQTTKEDGRLRYKNRMATAIPGAQVSPLSDPPQPTGRNLTAIQKSISAISGAVLTSLLVTPLDVVRVRLQAQQPTQQPPPPSALGNLNIPRLGYTTLGPTDSKSGVTTCCREVFFPRGFSVNGNGAHCEYIPFDSGASNVCAVEETGKRTFRGTWEGLVKIARYEGITSLWRGLSPTLYSSSVTILF